MTEIRPEAGPHECSLPVLSSYDTGKPVGTLRQCRGCSAWWECVPIPDQSGPSVVVIGPFTAWRRVRWWHFTARRRIETAPQVPATPPARPRPPAPPAPVPHGGIGNAHSAERNSRR